MAASAVFSPMPSSIALPRWWRPANEHARSEQPNRGECREGCPDRGDDNREPEKQPIHRKSPSYCHPVGVLGNRGKKSPRRMQLRGGLRGGTGGGVLADVIRPDQEENSREAANLSMSTERSMRVSLMWRAGSPGPPHDGYDFLQFCALTLMPSKLPLLLGYSHHTGEPP